MVEDVTTVAAPRSPAFLRKVPDSTRARLDAAVRTGGVVALWLGLLLVTYWWATGGGLQDLAGWASGLDSIGRLTGLRAGLS